MVNSVKINKLMNKLRTIVPYLVLTITVTALFIHYTVYAINQNNYSNPQPGYEKEEKIKNRKPELSLDILEEMAQSLKKREQNLDKREEEVIINETKLKVMERSVSMEIEKLDRLKTRVEKLFIKLDEKETMARNKLVKIYASMKPINAGNALMKLWNKDKLLVMSILKTMGGREAGRILDKIAAIDPETAADMSQAMKISDIEPR